MTEPFVDEILLFEDDRGSVHCVLDNIGSSEHLEVKRTYIVKNWSRGLIRAWHGHRNGWTGIHVIKGSAKLAALDMETCTKTFAHVLSDRQPGIFWVPPGWYNGAMSLEDDTRLLIYSTLTFEEVKEDDSRRTLTLVEKRSIFEVQNR